MTFITERASNDKELESGIGKYHIYLGNFKEFSKFSFHIGYMVLMREKCIKWDK